MHFGTKSLQHFNGENGECVINLTIAFWILANVFHQGLVCKQAQPTELILHLLQTWIHGSKQNIKIEYEEKLYDVLKNCYNIAGK